MTESANAPSASATSDEVPSISSSPAAAALDPQEGGELKELEGTIREAVKATDEPWFMKAGEAGITVGLLSMILVLRLFAVADWNWDVAASLAESFNIDDALAIILGTLFERPILSGIILSLALPLGIFREYWLAKHGLTRTRANNWFTMVALIATSYVLIRTFHIWWVFLVAAVLTAMIIGIALLSKHYHWHLQLSKIGKHVGILVGVALLFVASTIDTPWVENELIETKTEVINGYVLEASPGFLKLMTQEREILILPDNEVVSRSIIQDGD